jgi:glycerol-3-phosphate cytidylyltransferase-like family protein
MPIIDTESRIKFIRNLDLCDQILSYENTDQSNILSEFKIDVFVIGPEFGNTIEHKNTLKFCNDNNIEVVKIERTPEISTTEIIEKIKCK